LTGFAFGEGGMASPNLGVLAPPFDRLPGIGGRSKGAGEDMLGSWLESGWLEGNAVISAKSVIVAVDLSPESWITPLPVLSVILF